jgi:hypothetical protein
MPEEPFKVLNRPSFSPALAIVSIFFAVSGCAEDGVGKLFEEDGYWSLTSFSLAGEPTQAINENARGDGFLLHFDANNNVVQAAMCGESETQNAANSTCKLSAAPQWFCKCYGYAYEGSEMAWQEFQAGTMPPKPSLDGSVDGDGGAAGDAAADTGADTGADPGGDMGGDTGAVAGGTTRLTVGEVTDVAGTYTFQPLPAGLFGSDGGISSFTFREKTKGVFADVSCEPCI